MEVHILDWIFNIMVVILIYFNFPSDFVVDRVARIIVIILFLGVSCTFFYHYDLIDLIRSLDWNF